MELRRLVYKNVYGYLSGDLTFKRGENFLVGINGCGKTTALNLIRWMLEPSLAELCTLEHDLITLDLKYGKYLYSIRSRFLKQQHELKITTKDKSRNFKPIRTKLHVAPKMLRGQVHLREIKTSYENLAPEAHEVETWAFIFEELSSPVFVGLKRNVRENGQPPIIEGARRKSRQGRVQSPASIAIELMRDAFNTGRRHLVEINEELNRKVLELSFSGILSSGNLATNTSSGKSQKSKISQLKTRFKTSSDQGAYSKALSAEDVRSAVVKYLEDLEELLSSSEGKQDTWVILNQQNFVRASKMFDLFEKHEQRAKIVQAEMTTFEFAVNRFLNDSGKHIQFDEDTGAPQFICSNFDEKLSLSDLSSGEAQIVIVLSYFAFLAKTGVPIIIDEPELSLHVEWQSHFVEAVQQVMPSECQTIMATHSPEICGAKEVNVQAISARLSK